MCVRIISQQETDRASRPYIMYYTALFLRMLYHFLHDFQYGTKSKTEKTE